MPLEAAQTPKPVSTAIAEIIVEPDRLVRPTRPPIPAPVAQVVVVTTNPVLKKPNLVVGRSITGRASWYCSKGQPICFHGYPPGSAVAAAGPKLRAAICGVQSCTSWRNRKVTVCGRTCVTATLRDWCQCYWHEPHEKIIDLYYGLFSQTGGNVTVSW